MLLFLMGKEVGSGTSGWEQIFRNTLGIKNIFLREPLKFLEMLEPRKKFSKSS